MIIIDEVVVGLGIQQVDDKLIAVVNDELGRETRLDLTPLLVLGNDLERFLKPILDGLRLKRPQTIKNQISKLRALGEGLEQLRITSLPRTESEWQSLILNVHRFVITRTDRKASLKSRCASDWLSIRGFVVDLVETGLVPVSVHIPPVREALESIDISPYQERLLGQATPVAVGVCATIDKMLCSVSLARTDAEYLEEIRDTLAHRRHTLFEALTDYWRTLKANLDFGRRLIASVDWAVLKPQVARYPLRDPTNHPANPLRGTEALANYLSIIKHEYGGCPPSDDDLRNMKREFEFLPRFVPLGPISNWINAAGTPSFFHSRAGWSDRNVLWWWQGRISHFDVSIIAALLIMLQPSWTPGAVMFSRIANRNGKQYLEFSDNDASYEMEKPRAKVMKRETLDPLAYEIISTLIAESQEQRERLEREHSPLASLLFLPYGKKGTSVAPIPSMAPNFLSGKGNAKDGERQWIGALYPALTEGGLGRGTISFKKIRSTEGVLEWFRTKSLRAVSRKLGNSERVVLQHYIPKALLDAWNTRMARRFQNLWLSAAAANEDFLLDVTDFSSLAELHAFLKDMLQLHAPTDSPLAELLHKRCDAPISAGQGSDAPAVRTGRLHIAISKGALSALYAYQVSVLHRGLLDSSLDRPDVLTGLSPRHFLTLADLLQSTLPHDKNPEYVACHEAALRGVMDPAVRDKWLQLME